MADIIIDNDKCDNCGDCADVCPMEVLILEDAFIWTYVHTAFTVTAFVRFIDS